MSATSLHAEDRGGMQTNSELSVHLRRCRVDQKQEDKFRRRWFFWWLSRGSVPCRQRRMGLIDDHLHSNALRRGVARQTSEQRQSVSRYLGVVREHCREPSHLTLLQYRHVHFGAGVDQIALDRFPAFSPDFRVPSRWGHPLSRLDRKQRQHPLEVNGK